MKRILMIMLVGLLAVSPLTAMAQVQSVKPTDVSKSSPVTVSKFYTNVSNRISWLTCLSFTNASTKEIRAIQFGFTYLDAFDTPLTTLRGDRVGSFAPDILIEGPDNANDVGSTGNVQKGDNCWSTLMVVGSLSSVNVQVLKVRYADGSIWVAPSITSDASAKYMRDNDPANHEVDPPNTLTCNFLGPMKWLLIEKNHNPKLEKCVMNWEKTHGNIHGWPPAYETPSPNPSPTP